VPSHIIQLPQLACQGRLAAFDVELPAHGVLWISNAEGIGGAGRTGELHGRQQNPQDKQPGGDAPGTRLHSIFAICAKILFSDRTFSGWANPRPACRLLCNKNPPPSQARELLFINSEIEIDRGEESGCGGANREAREISPLAIDAT
jgi:hypothetical protein